MNHSTEKSHVTPTMISPDAIATEFNLCQDAVRRLNDYLSHELDAEETEAVQAHLSRCRGCFAKFHFEVALLRTIREKATQSVAPQNLRDKILSLITPKLVPDSRMGVADAVAVTPMHPPAVAPTY